MSDSHTFEVDVHSWQLLAVNGEALPACSKCGKCCQRDRPECAAANLVSETWDEC